MRNIANIFGFIFFIIIFSECKKSVLSSDNNLNSFSADNLTTKTVGRQLVISLPTSDRTYPTSQALLWMPKAYKKNPSDDKMYPLIFNLYGQTQTGTDLNKMLEGHTMSAFIADGFNVTAVNPVNGKDYAFFVCSPQCPVTWGWSAKHVSRMIEELKELYPIDSMRIYMTGYSSGGWGLWSCITDNNKLTRQFAAIVPISSASADHPDELSNVAKFDIACINICGDKDSFYPNAVKYTKTINSNKPQIPAKLITLEGVGHNNSCKYAYDKSWKGVAGNLNIYEWMLQYKRQE